MGANTFYTKAHGTTAVTAFNAAVATARDQYGRRGYTGTIAEKTEFEVIAVPAGVDPVKHAEALIDADDPLISDKWGPAGAVRLDTETWLFFGWASS